MKPIVFTLEVLSAKLAKDRKCNETQTVCPGCASEEIKICKKEDCD